ncbi:MAG TPA: hypothetical protein VF828_04070 [Patescibacteria group bacterium]
MNKNGQEIRAYQFIQADGTPLMGTDPENTTVQVPVVRLLKANELISYKGLGLTPVPVEEKANGSQTTLPEGGEEGHKVNIAPAGRSLFPGVHLGDKHHSWMDRKDIKTTE